MLANLSIAQLSKLGHIWAKKGMYYQQETDLVGRAEGVRVQEGNVFVDMEATGTRSEALLKAVTGKQGRRVSLHFCPPGCNALLTDEFLLHAKEFEEVDHRAQDWFTNLVVVAPRAEGEQDELRSMRADAERRKEELEGRGDKSPKAKKDKRRRNGPTESRRPLQKRREGWPHQSPMTWRLGKRPLKLSLPTRAWIRTPKPGRGS